MRGDTSSVDALLYPFMCDHAPESVLLSLRNSPASLSRTVIGSRGLHAAFPEVRDATTSRRERLHFSSQLLMRGLPQLFVDDVVATAAEAVERFGRRLLVIEGLAHGDHRGAYAEPLALLARRFRTLVIVSVPENPKPEAWEKWSSTVIEIAAVASRPDRDPRGFAGPRRDVIVSRRNDEGALQRREAAPAALVDRGRRLIDMFDPTPPDEAAGHARARAARAPSVGTHGHDAPAGAGDAIGELYVRKDRGEK